MFSPERIISCWYTVSYYHTGGSLAQLPSYLARCVAPKERMSLLVSRPGEGRRWVAGAGCEIAGRQRRPELAEQPTRQVILAGSWTEGLHFQRLPQLLQNANTAVYFEIRAWRRGSTFDGFLSYYKTQIPLFTPRLGLDGGVPLSTAFSVITKRKYHCLLRD